MSLPYAPGPRGPAKIPAAAIQRIVDVVCAETESRPTVLLAIGDDALRGQPPLGGAARQDHRPDWAARDAEGVAIERDLVEDWALRRVVVTRVQGGQQVVGVEVSGPHHDPSTEAVVRVGEVGVVAGVGEQPTPGLQGSIEELLALRTVGPQGGQAVVVDLHCVHAVEQVVLFGEPQGQRVQARMQQDHEGAGPVCPPDRLGLVLARHGREVGRQAHR